MQTSLSKIQIYLLETMHKKQLTDKSFDLELKIVRLPKPTKPTSQKSRKSTAYNCNQHVFDEIKNQVKAKNGNNL